MEKLKELLKEYIRQKYEDGEYGVYINKKNKLILESQYCFMDYGTDEEWYEDMEFGESIIISKGFGFIEKLVENDKIDLVKFSDKLSNSNGTMEDRYRYLNSDFGLYHTLLMLLAIQDEPVKFLSEILKDE